MKLAYYNGNFGKWEEIKIPLSDRAVFFADGVYDAVLGANKIPYLLDLHIERFLSNAKRLHIPVHFSEAYLKKIIDELIYKSGVSDFFLYFQLSASANDRRHAPRDEELSNLLVTIKDFKPDCRELRLISYPEIRQRFCNIKTLNLLGSVLASEAAYAAECNEAVFVLDSYVTECAHSNIMIVKNGSLITHPTNERILPGIMRAKALAVARACRISIQERPFSLSELMDADDVLITSTSKLIQRATELDGYKISNGNRDTGDKIMADVLEDFFKICKI